MQVEKTLAVTIPNCLQVQHGSIASYVALFIVLTAILSTASFVTVQRPTLDNMYNSVQCLVFVVIFIFLATKVVEDVFLVSFVLCTKSFSFSIAISFINPTLIQFLSPLIRL